MNNFMNEYGETTLFKFDDFGFASAILSTVECHDFLIGNWLNTFRVLN